MLVRQALVFEAGRRGSEVASVRLPRPIGVSDEILEGAGLGLDSDGRIFARPWRPTWLNAEDFDGTVEGRAAQAIRQRFGAGDSAPAGDPFLKTLGWDRYRSVGQRAAVRSALLTPPGRSVVIDLPTGEGKSLVFQAINAVGFAGDALDGEAGVTVVVVPTVGLAYDHEAKCQTDPSETLAYVGGGGEARKQAVLERINGAGEGLLFAAPEAVCASLRAPLVRLAAAGKLKALVIDEAHLVDAWGTGFRTEFQTLAGFRDELVRASPPGRALRTIMLSATLTPETLDTLRTLFGTEGELPLVSAAQVRPEADYWVADAASEEDQVSRVLEAIGRAPRPAILYVTEVAQAIAWQARLDKLGYKRLAAFHGKTSDDERVSVLKDWSRGEIDLVVATSAFGLGIDYPHVRSVIHACVPETFDRFYQEVGRGGRDGCTALSLVIPAAKDFRVAEGLSRERVITVARGRVRWSAMFSHSETRHLGGMRFCVPLDVAPGSGVEDIDLVGERSTQWNARVLTLMARAGALRLSGSDYDPDTQRPGGVYETVELLTDRHLDPKYWEAEVEPVRASVAAARRRNFNLMSRRLKDQPCPADQIRELYSASRVDLATPRCRLCRAGGAACASSARKEPASPWSAPSLRADVIALLDERTQLALFYDPQLAGPKAERQTASLFEALTTAGLCSIVLVGPPPALFARALKRLESRVVFLESVSHVGQARLPQGPRLALYAPGVPFRRHEAAGSDPRILLLPKTIREPGLEGERIAERWTGAAMSMMELTGRIGL